MYFVVILMLFVVSYAVAAYAVMYPQSELSIDLMLRVLRLGYWNLYGELLLDDIEGKAFFGEREREREREREERERDLLIYDCFTAEEPDCSYTEAVYNSNTLPRCAVKHRRVIGLVMMGIYLIFANVMLLNILIAMFT